MRRTIKVAGKFREIGVTIAMRWGDELLVVAPEGKLDELIDAIREAQRRLRLVVDATVEGPFRVALETAAERSASDDDLARALVEAAESQSTGEHRERSG